MTDSSAYQSLVEHRDLLGLAGVVAVAVVGGLLARRGVLRVGEFPAPPAPPARLAPALIAVAAFCVAAFFGVQRPPHAAVGDEFSYLLAADTFASGRLTNPSPPSPEHFESFQIVVEPTYMSKYPPAQGAVLALGQVVFGHPLAGVWLSAAAFALACWWALRARLTVPWAFAFTVLAVLRFGSTGYWAQSYWGGLVAAIGGALVVGAVLRLVRAVRTSDAVWLFLGTAILATSRPFEGLVLCAGAYSLLAFAWWRRRPADFGRAALVRAGVPWLVGVVALGVFLAHYNAAVTGDPLTLPYALHEAEYAAAPNFIFQEPIPTPEYRHAEHERFWAGWTLWLYEERHEQGVLATLPFKLGFYGGYYSGWVWLPFLLIGLVARRTGGARWFVPLGLAAVAVETFDARHYASPFTLPVVLVCASGAVAWCQARRSWVRASGLCALAGVVLVAFAESAIETVSWKALWPQRRLELIADLSERDGRDVVFVRTDLTGLTPRERWDWINLDWVYNSANIREQEVIFARDLGAKRNAALLAELGPRTGHLLLLPRALDSERIVDALTPFTLPDPAQERAASAPARDRSEAEAR